MIITTIIIEVFHQPNTVRQYGFPNSLSLKVWWSGVWASPHKHVSWYRRCYFVIIIRMIKRYLGQYTIENANRSNRTRLRGGNHIHVPRIDGGPLRTGFKQGRLLCQDRWLQHGCKYCVRLLLARCGDFLSYLKTGTGYPVVRHFRVFLANFYSVSCNYKKNRAGEEMLENSTQDPSWVVLGGRTNNYSISINTNFKQSRHSVYFPAHSIPPPI